MDWLSTIRAGLLTRPDFWPSLRHRLLQNPLPHRELCSSHMHFPHRGMYPVLAFHALPGPCHWGTHVHLYVGIQICAHRGVLVQLCSGAIFGPSIAIVGHWFKKRRAIALAIVAIGSSAGGTVMPIAFGRLLNEVGLVALFSLPPR